jgi:hypothetical protein
MYFCALKNARTPLQCEFRIPCTNSTLRYYRFYYASTPRLSRLQTRSRPRPIVVPNTTHTWVRSIEMTVRTFSPVRAMFCMFNDEDTLLHWSNDIVIIIIIIIVILDSFIKETYLEDVIPNSHNLHGLIIDKFRPYKNMATDIGLYNTARTVLSGY